jgi:hypothetical protein
METGYHYTTVINALKELNENGFVTDFNLHENEIMNHPNNYRITDVYRYDGGNNPDEEATVYGMESIFGEKGVFVAGGSANSNNIAAKVLNNVKIW